MVHPSTRVFMSLKTSSLQILTGSLSFFLFFQHIAIAKKHISGVLRWLWCLYYLRAALFSAMQQLRSQKHSGGSAPHLALVAHVTGLPCSWSRVLAVGSSLCLLLHCTVQNDPGTFQKYRMPPSPSETLKETELQCFGKKKKKK